MVELGKVRRISQILKQPIVGDSIEYHTDNKSDGYNVVKGKKLIKLKPLAIAKGGRGKTAKKTIGFKR